MMSNMYIEQKYLSYVSSKLRNFKRKNNTLWNFSCPYCGDSQTNKTKARGYIFAKGNNLIYKCHNCGVGAGFKNFLKYLDSRVYNEYILERYKNKNTDSVVKFNNQPNLDKRSSGSLKTLKKISALSHEHPAKKYVQKRQIPSDRHFELFYAPKFFAWVNTIIPNKYSSLSDDHPRLVIPFFDENNKLFAFQGRAFGNEKLKYITIILDKEKDKLYGLNHVNWNKKVYVVEGPIDSLFLDNCIATAQSDLRVKKDNVILIPDNEPRNKEIVKQVANFIEEGYPVVLWPEDVKEKDINEMVLSGKTKHQIQQMIDQNTYQGIMAKTKFIFWKKVELNEKILSWNSDRN